MSACGLVVFIDLNTYILKGTNFKTFLKEYYAVALECWTILKVEHETEHDIFLVLMEFV